MEIIFCQSLLTITEFSQNKTKNIKQKNNFSVISVVQGYQGSEGGMLSYTMPGWEVEMEEFKTLFNLKLKKLPFLVKSNSETVLVNEFLPIPVSIIQKIFIVIQQAFLYGNYLSLKILG